MPREPQFDIFSGQVDDHPIWLETVEGLDHARRRMAQIAQAKPGRYFVYNSQTGKVVAESTPAGGSAEIQP